MEHKTLQNIMKEETIPKAMLILAAPSMATMLCLAFFHIADTFFLTRINFFAAGAAGILFTIQNIIQSIGFTCGMGGGSRIAMLIGEEEEEMAGEYALTAMVLTVVLGGVLTGLSLWKLPTLLVFLGADNEMMVYGMVYGRYLCLLAPGICLSYTLQNLLRAEGGAKQVLISVAGSCVLGVFLEFMLTIVFHFGVGGAGVSYLMYVIIQCIFLLYWYFSGQTMVRVTWKKLLYSINFVRCLEIIRLGFASFVRQSIGSVANTVQNRMLSGYGAGAVSAMAIGFKLYSVLFALIVGYIQGYSPVAGYFYGEGNCGKLKRSCSHAIKAGVVFHVFFGIIAFFFSRNVLQLFIREIQYLNLVDSWMRYQSILLPFTMTALLCSGLYQAMGKVKQAVLLASLRQGMVYLPGIYICSYLWGFMGVVYIQPIADGISFLVCLFYLIKFFRQPNYQKT